MTIGQLLLLGMRAFWVCTACRRALAETVIGRVVQLAELEIDPAQLDSYKALLKEEIEASVRRQPGVLALFAVSVKNHPAQIRLFETYADANAYQAHVATPQRIW